VLTRSVIPAADAPEGKRGDLVDWREQSACRGYPLKPDDDPWHPAASKQAKAPAMQVCWEVCPVREDCLEKALATETLGKIHGIRGGHTEAERTSMIRKAVKDRRAAKRAALAA
jgi:hypothetical protein